MKPKPVNRTWNRGPKARWAPLPADPVDPIPEPSRRAALSFTGEELRLDPPQFQSRQIEPVTPRPDGAVCQAPSTAVTPAKPACELGEQLVSYLRKVGPQTRDQVLDAFAEGEGRPIVARVLDGLTAAGTLERVSGHFRVVRKVA